MKIKILFVLLFVLPFLSCKKDETLLIIEQQKEAKKQEQIFAAVNTNWNFNATPSNATSQQLTQNWAEWRNFLKELSLKPKSSIGAFQQKAKTLSKKALELNNNIPIRYNLPEVKSRIAAIMTKINAMNLYIHLGQIPDGKVIKLIPEINTEIQGLQTQLAEIDQRSQIKLEDGEADMIKMLDTSRAIFNTKPDTTQVKKETNSFNKKRRFLNSIRKN
jgi:hypothetical protein